LPDGVAAWGPNKAGTGGPDFYNVTFTPKDPALAVRQLKTELGAVRNQPEGFELAKLGTGRIFERNDEQLAKYSKLPNFLRPRPGAAVEFRLAGSGVDDLGPTFVSAPETNLPLSANCCCTAICRLRSTALH
jgi:hypothetical protein